MELPVAGCQQIKCAIIPYMAIRIGLIAGLLFFGACRKAEPVADTSQQQMRQKWAEVKVGMTKEELIDLLGPPQSVMLTSDTPPVEILFYRVSVNGKGVHQSGIQVGVSGGKVLGVEPSYTQNW